jgi:hypothetical protein
MFKWVYARYVKACSNTSCSPGAVVIALAIALCVVGYIYRHIIEEALIFTVLGVAVVAISAGLVAITKTVQAWRTAHAEMVAEDEELKAALAEPATAPLPVAEPPTAPIQPVEVDLPGRLASENPIAADADHLANENVELAFDEQGCLIEKVGGK